MRLYAAILVATLCSPVMAADYLGKVTSVADGDTFTMEAETAGVRAQVPRHRPSRAGLRVLLPA